MRTLHSYEPNTRFRLEAHAGPPDGPRDGGPGCGTTRPTQEQGYLLERRLKDSAHYLLQTHDRYVALLQRTKAHYSDYIAGRRPRAPVIDYLIISGGGDWDAFGAGILKGWGRVPPSDPLARPRFDIVTGVSTGALIAPFAYLGDVERFHRILLASWGIPGAFPYREIEGAMYVDGGVTSNMIFGDRIPEENRLPALWQGLYPDVPMPKLRYWMIFNNQFQASPTVVKARWFDIISRSIPLSTRSAMLASMRQLHLMAEVVRLKRHADVEVRIVAVPDDWSPPKPGTFVKESMNNLADLGERMGADPTSWRTSPP